MADQASEGISQCCLWGQAELDFSLLGRGLVSREDSRIEKHYHVKFGFVFMLFFYDREFFSQLCVLLVDVATLYSNPIL